MDNNNNGRSHDDLSAKDLTDRLKSIFGSEVKDKDKLSETSEFKITLDDRNTNNEKSDNTKEFPKIGDLSVFQDSEDMFSTDSEDDEDDPEAELFPETDGIVYKIAEDSGIRVDETETEEDIPSETEAEPVEEAPKPTYGMVYHFRRQSRQEYEASKRSAEAPAAEEAENNLVEAEETPAEAVAAESSEEVIPETTETVEDDSAIAGASEIDDLLKKYLSDSEYKRMIERQKKLEEIEQENKTEEPEAVLPEEETAEISEETDAEDSEEDVTAEETVIENSENEIPDGDTIEFSAVTADVIPDELLPDSDFVSEDEETNEVSGEIDISEKIKDAENFISQYEGGSTGAEPTEEVTEAGESTENTEDQIDETDLNLMLAFGMDEELKNTVGEDKANEIAADADKASELFEEEEAETETPVAYEYTTPQQNKEIFKKFKKDYNNCIVKLFICAAFLILTFFYENIGLFGTTFSGAFNPIAYPVVYVMADLQIVLLCSVLVWRKIKDGALSAIRLKPSPDSISAILLLFTVIFNILVCIFNKSGDLRLFSFPMTMCVMLMLVSEFLNMRRMIFSFNIVASKRPKFALDKLDPESAPLETEAFYDILPDRPSIFKITKSSFVDGFFRRTNETSHNKGVIGVVLPIAVIVSVVMFVVSLYLTSDVLKALTVSYASLTLAMPLAMFLTYSMPMYRASRLAFETGSAIIGESALDEYSTASSISFDDRDVFPSYGVKVKSVKVFGENRIDQIIFNAASVFRIVGGPLSDVLDKATMDIGHTDNVELLAIENDGIEAMVDETHVHIGKSGYLRRCGFVPETDIDDDEIEAGGDINIMYVVIDNEVSAKMYVQYHIDPDFDFMLKKLYKAGICVGIKTLDPNIDDEMLSMRIHLDKYQVKILKCKEPGAARSAKQNIDSGIVSKHSTKALLQTFALCDKVQHITKTNIILNIFAIILSVLISVFIVIFGLAGGIFSVYVVLYQFFWIIPMLIINRLFI